MSLRPANPTRIRGSALVFVVGLVTLLVIAACSGAAQPSQASALVVKDAWVQVSAGVDQPAAGYFTVANLGSTDDQLVSASSPGAASVELHQSMPDGSGMMEMRSIGRVDCPVGGTLTFAPGGYHLMISGLTAPLKAGDQLELDLVFAHAGRIVVEAEVRQV